MALEAEVSWDGYLWKLDTCPLLGLEEGTVLEEETAQ